MMKNSHPKSTGSSKSPESTIPRIGDQPILDASPRPAFRVATHDIIESIRQQFPDRRLAFREMGQNSVDAGATRIYINLRHEDGRMVAEFLDNGCGMTRQVIEKNYLTLFDSSKEGRPNCIGYYSLGRISAFVYPLESLELITLSEGCPGYRLVINGDYSGRLYEVEAGETAQMLDSEHGTLVRMRYPVADEEAFFEEAAAINESVKRELCWLHPEVTITVFKRTGDKIERSVESVNEPLTVPGRLAHTVEVKLASGLGSATVAMGVEGETSRLSYFREEVMQTGLEPVTLCIGRIPALRTKGLPWTGSDAFMLQNLRVVIDSFQFKTNIGRNIVYLDQPFVRELLPKIFHHLILERYIPALAKAFTSSSGNSGSSTALRKLLGDVCVESSNHNFPIPPEIFQAPMLPALFRQKDYTLQELDNLSQHEPIYYTYAKKDIDDRLDQDETEAEGSVCISTSEVSYDFIEWLRRRYGSRFQMKNVDFVAREEETVGNKRITLKVRERLAVPDVIDGFGGLLSAIGGNEFTSTISCGCLARFDGHPETRTPAYVFPQPRRVLLNLANPHIRRLIKLMEGAHHLLASHFLFREVLFAIGQKMPVAYREQLLSADVSKRFADRVGAKRKFDDFLKEIGNELDPF